MGAIACMLGEIVGGEGFVQVAAIRPDGPIETHTEAPSNVASLVESSTRKEKGPRSLRTEGFAAWRAVESMHEAWSKGITGHRRTTLRSDSAS